MSDLCYKYFNHLFIQSFSLNFSKPSISSQIYKLSTHINVWFAFIKYPNLETMWDFFLKQCIFVPNKSVELNKLKFTLPISMLSDIDWYI